MKLLQTNFLQRLNAKYRWGMMALILGCIAPCWLPAIIFSLWLLHLLGIPIGAPVKDHPNGVLWATVFSVLFVASTIIGYFFVTSHVLAWILRRRGWSAAQIRGLLLHSEIPPHWLIPK